MGIVFWDVFVVFIHFWSSSIKDRHRTSIYIQSFITIWSNHTTTSFAQRKHISNLRLLTIIQTWVKSNLTFCIILLKISIWLELVSTGDPALQKLWRIQGSIRLRLISKQQRNLLLKMCTRRILANIIQHHNFSSILGSPYNNSSILDITLMSLFGWFIWLDFECFTIFDTLELL